jgi:hypothetical protein
VERNFAEALEVSLAIDYFMWRRALHIAFKK